MASNPSSYLNKATRFIKMYVKYFFGNKPKVYWWSMVVEQGSVNENFGDIITPYLVEKITKIKPQYFNVNTRFSNYFKHYLMTGSIIGRSNKNTIVWGSGIIRKDQQIEGGSFVAVRGPRTAARLKELNFETPDVYGDPGLLLPLFYKPNIEKKFKYGVVSHYKDSEKITCALAKRPDILHIKLTTETIEPVVDKIVSCDYIISTSLHGLITAHSYNIPAAWWRVSNELSGDDIKFTDYFESVNEYTFSNNSAYDIEELIGKAHFILPSEEIIKNIQNKLLDSFPIKKG